MPQPSFEALLDSEPDFAPPDDSLTLLDDDVLLDLVRAGSNEAYAVLFGRYRHPAHRLAAYFSNTVDAKDIVAETFAEVLHQLRRGQGPHTSFRSYLFTSVRREAGKRARLHKRVSVTDDLATIDKPVQFGAGNCDPFERDLVRAAFASLPVRWRTVLWQLDVDGRKPNELASQLGISPNAVSALAYRAREGLRKAYLEQHVPTKGKSWTTACQDVRSRLVNFVRGSATTRDVNLIDPHLEECVPCRDVYLELEEVNTHLGAVSGALALGFAAPAATGLLGGAVAKATFVAKSIGAFVGSTAAVVATSVTVLNVPVDVVHIPGESPADPAPIHALPTALTPEQEPDRTIGPAADRPTAGQDQAAVPLPHQETSTPDPASSPDSSTHVDSTHVELDVSGSGSRTSASVGAAGIQISASVDLRKPETTRIKVEHDTKAALTNAKKRVQNVEEKLKDLVERDTEK